MEMHKITTKVLNIADFAAKAKERQELQSAFQNASTDAQGYLLGKALKNTISRNLYRALMMGLAEGEGNLCQVMEDAMYPEIAECNANARASAADSSELEH